MFEHTFRSKLNLKIKRINNDYSRAGRVNPLTAGAAYICVFIFY